MRKLIVLLTLLAIHFSYAQKEASGEIIYKKTIKLITPKQKNATYNNDVKSILNSLDKLSYMLKFNKTQSYFKLEKLMDSDINKLNRRAVGGGKGKYEFYTDLKNNNCIEISKLGSEIFLVENTKPKYKLTNETKKINGYNCYKAIASETVFFSKIKKSLEDQENIVVAWYTNEIPASFGPLNFFGLPGLVLELQYNNVTYTAVKINLTNNNIKIMAPTKGKKLSKEEYEALMIKTIKQMGAN